MNDDPMPLDGNAAAGALQELFAFDVTMATVHCWNCDAAGPLAKLRYFGSPQAMVLRCPRCDVVNLRLLATGRTINLDLSGVARLQIGSGN